MKFFPYENNTNKNLDELINKLSIELEKIEMQIIRSQQYNIKRCADDAHTKMKIS